MELRIRRGADVERLAPIAVKIPMMSLAVLTVDVQDTLLAPESGKNLSAEVAICCMVAQGEMAGLSVEQPPELAAPYAAE